MVRRLSDFISDTSMGFNLTAAEMVSFQQNVSGSVVTTVGNKLQDFVSVKDFGAIGDGTTNDTAAVQTAVNAGLTIYVGPGTYMVDQIVIDTPTHLILDPLAVIKARLPSSPATALDTTFWILKFVSGSSGSSIRGGTIDGNRDVLAPYYNGHERLGKDNHWGGLRTEFVNDIAVEGVTFQNVMNQAVYFYGGQRCSARINVKNSGVAFALQGSPGTLSKHDIDCVAESISNYVNGTPYYFFQHGATAGFLKNSRITVRMKDYGGSGQGTDGNSTSGGKEPVPIALNLYAMKRCTVDAGLDTYNGPAIHIGVNMSSVRDSYFRLDTYEFENGLTLGSVQNCDFDVNLDGNYKNIAGYPRQGIVVTFGGVFDPVASGLAGETGANNTTDGCTIRGRVQRFGVGVRDEGSDITYSPGFTVLGCSSDGFQLVGPTGSSASFPVARVRPNGCRLLSGCIVRTNGNSGIVYTRGLHDTIINCDVRNNGQRISGGAPYAIYVSANADEGKHLSIIGNKLDPSESITDTGGISFIPGTAIAAPTYRRYDESSTLAYVYDFVLRNPNNWDVGQWVVLKNVLSGPADATGKIINISADIATIAFASAHTFVETSSLTTLSGTGSTSGTTITGSGTAFTTEIDFPAYLQSGSQYRQISYVNSNTSAVLTSAFSSNIAAGSTLKVVAATITNASYTNTRGLFVNGNVTSGPMLLRGNQNRRVANTISAASFPGIAQGSEFNLDYSLTMTGTSLSNQIVNGLPNHCVVDDVRLTILTTITGHSGTLSIEVRDNTTVIATPISTFSGVSAGTVMRGPIGNCPSVTSGLLGVHLVSSVGNPSGAVTSRVSLRKLSEVL